MDLTIVIPCLNEDVTIAKAVAEALEGLKNAGLSGEVVVSDNGSTDGSQEIARKAGARVVNAPMRGYGAALHYGILAARGKWVLFGDADMSYDFNSVAVFKKYIDEKDPSRQKDLVLGSRLGGQIDPGAMPFLNRHLGTPALNLAIRFCFGLVTSDCNSGMRLVNRSFYLKLPMRTPGMEWASEFLIKSKLMGVRYAEVPIHYRRDQRNRRPHLRRWRDGWRHLKTIVLLSPNRLVMFPSLLFGAAAVALIAQRQWDMALVSTIISTCGISLAMLINLVLHADGVRTSAIIPWLTQRPIAEALLGFGAIFSVVGIASYVIRVVPRLGMIVMTAGMIMMLTSYAWGVLVAHSVRHYRLPDNPKESDSSASADERVRAA